MPGTIGYQPGSNRGLVRWEPAANNAAAANDANTVDYQGARLSALWKINDDWNFLLQQNYQDMEADGYFYTYPQDPNGVTLQPYQITAFTPAYNKDNYESTAWTLNGQLRRSQSGLHRQLHGPQHRQDSRTTRTTCAAPWARITAASARVPDISSRRAIPVLR